MVTEIASDATDESYDYAYVCNNPSWLNAPLIVLLVAPASSCSEAVVVVVALRVE